MDPVQVRTVHTDRLDMDYVIFGGGRKSLVILPGISIKPITLSAAALEGGFRRFAEEYTVYVFDRRSGLADGCTVEEMTDDTADAMKALGISGADVFGASQGGMIALVLAARYPALVAKAVVASSSAHLEERYAALLTEWARLARAGRVRELNRSVFAHLYTREYLDTYRDIFAAMETDGTPDELARFAAMSDACVTFDFRGELANVHCPVLVACAECDTALGADASRLIAERTGGTLVVYPRYGHAVYDEAPDFRDRMWDFFRG